MYLNILTRSISSPTEPPKQSTEIFPTNSSSYTNGLTGVDQEENYLFINTSIVFFLILCGACFILRIYNISNNYFRQVIACSVTGNRQTIFSRNRTSLWPWIKRHILYAPLWTKRHNKEIQLSSALSVGTLPSRFHTVLLGVYVITNVAYCFALNYSNDVQAAIIAELRGRSGALATLNLIPTILFALRNNPFIPLLQVSYDTFNLFHRWLARIVIAETIVHVCAWAANAIVTGGMQEIYALLRDTISFRWGTVAAVTFVMIGLQAWSPVRHAFYETFLTTHRVLVLLALVGVYVHLDTANLPQLPYIWLGVLMWITEWIVRTGRIVYHNYSQQRNTTVLIEAFETEACRLTFDLARPFKPQPGSHVHIYLPRIALWSSHPFSIAWWNEIKSANADEKLTRSDNEAGTLGSTRTSVSLIVRARSGMTRKLYDLASNSPNRVLTLHGALEGPYGGHESLDSYGTILLFAGGVGITHQLSYVRHLLEGAVAGTVAAQKIILVWSIPQIECMDWIRPWMDEILSMTRRTEFLQMMTYVTKKKGQATISASGTVQVVPGRCDVQVVVDAEFMDRIGAMAVTVCGPGAFADDVRCAVRKRVEAGSIDFIEEAFTY